MIFLGRNHINVIRVIRLSQEDGDVPEGGGWGGVLEMERGMA